jgi:hypothetical protein
MLEASGGGGGTDWWSMDMATIQQLAQSPDIDAHYQIVDGWQKSYELVGDHLAQVTLYRDSLAEAWPPEKSSAAKAYIDRLNTLIGHLQETQDAAIANHDALSSASLSLSLAKTEMNKLYSQWDANNKALAAFNQQQAQKKTPVIPGKPVPSPSPSGEEPPPVTADQQEALRQKAIVLMSGVSSDLAQAQLKVVRPAPYTPNPGIDKNVHEVGTGAASPPTLPPIVPTTISGGGSFPGGSTVSPHKPAPFPTNTAGVPSTGFPSGGGSNPGLVLGGTNPTSTLPPPATAPGPITALPSGGGPISGPGVLTPNTGPFLPPGTLPPSGGGSLPVGEGSLRSFGGGVPEGGLKAMPPGGIIGRAPGGALGEPSGSRLGTQRVNPVGGVIGEPGMGGGMMSGGRNGASSGRGGTVSMGRGGLSASTQQPYGQVGGRRGGRRDQSEDVRWDPNNPWATDVGVDPVVLPPTEQPIDPGPAIGLG